MSFTIKIDPSAVEELKRIRVFDLSSGRRSVNAVARKGFHGMRPCAALTSTDDRHMPSPNCSGRRFRTTSWAATHSSFSTARETAVRAKTTCDGPRKAARGDRDRS